MSIIGTGRERKAGFRSGMVRGRAEEGRREAPKILDLSILKDYVAKVFDFMKPEGAEQYASNRKHSHVWEVPIHHLLGKVNEPTWVFMIESQAKWVIESWQAIQANGRWRVYDYEIKTESKDSVTCRSVSKDETLDIVESFEYLVIGIQIVDIRGERDLVYDMGRPSNRRPEAVVSSGVSDKRIEKQEKQLDEQKRQIFQLQNDLNKQNELMAALLSELQQQKGAKKRVVRK